ncbi:Cellular tumor antigen p53, partial [Taenia solium]
SQWDKNEQLDSRLIKRKDSNLEKLRQCLESSPNFRSPTPQITKRLLHQIPHPRTHRLAFTYNTVMCMVRTIPRADWFIRHTRPTHTHPNQSASRHSARECNPLRQVPHSTMEALSKLSSGFHDFAAAVSAHTFTHDDVGALPTPPSILPLVPTDTMINSGDGSGASGPLMNVKMSPGGGSGSGSGEMEGKMSFVVDHQPPPKKLFSDDIPVLDPFPGYYGFDLYRPLCEDAYDSVETKPSTAYFFFKDDQGWTNLYAKKAPTWWTLSYWCQRQPPDGCFIRLTPVYGTSDKQQEVIQRCLEDFMVSPTPGLSRYSMILVGNSNAEYFYDPTTERLCVTLPYERPKEGCEYSQFNGKFTCFNSCLYNGGQGNKKPLYLIITLERPIKNGSATEGPCEVLGRQCLKFRSCACPKRDKDNNERRMAQDMGEGSLSSSSVLSSKRRREGVSQRSSRGSRSKNFPTAGDRVGTPQFFQQDEISSSSGYDDLVQIDGESFHLILMPAYLPGGAHTLRQMRSALLRIFQTARDCEDDRKNSNSAASGYSSERQDELLQALNSMEGRTASLLRDLQASSTFVNPNSCSTDSQPNSSTSQAFTGPTGGSVGALDPIGGSTLDLLAYDHLHSQHLIKSENSFLQPFSGQTNEYHRSRVNYPSTLTAPLDNAHQQRVSGCFESNASGTDLSTFNAISMESSAAAAYAMMPSAFQSFRDSDSIHHYQPNVFVTSSQNTVNSSAPSVVISQDNNGALVAAFGAAVSSSQSGGKLFEEIANNRQHQCHQTSGTDVSMGGSTVTKRSSKGGGVCHARGHGDLNRNDENNRGKPTTVWSGRRQDR